MNHPAAFMRVDHPHNHAEDAAPPDLNGLHTLLSEEVVDAFTRLTVLRDGAVGLAVIGARGAADAPPPAAHSACARHAGSRRCRRSWHLHLSELTRRPAAHWHRCVFGVHCAVVPVVHRGACLAIVRLTCPDAPAEPDFARHVELLDILVENFVISHVRFLDRLTGGGATDAPPAAAPRSFHPRIARALKYVEDHLSEPALSVGDVARALKLHPNYLSGLFVERHGQRLSRFILNRRVDRAKELLARTDAMIKEISRSVGFAHPNWFCHIFAGCTGLTPVEYRRQARLGLLRG